MPNNLVDLSFFVKVFAVNEALSNNTTAPSKPTAPTADDSRRQDRRFCFVRQKHPKMDGVKDDLVRGVLFAC